MAVGFLRYGHCTAGVTDRRLIIAQATKEMRRIGGVSLHERRGTLFPDVLLAESLGNVATPLAEMASARLETDTNAGDDALYPNGLIPLMRCAKEVLTFGTHALLAPEARDLLRAVLGDRVH